MPVITISRMFGAGGSEVADRIARGLRWALVDNAFVDGVAGRLGTTPAAIDAIQERTPSLAERIADTFALGSSEVVAAAMSGSLPPTEERVLEMTRRLIDETLMRGPAVLVGRGAQTYLERREDALHVLCCAPFDALVARVAHREGITTDAAVRLVKESNHQRERFIRQHWRREWLNPEHYHLCLNTAWLTVDGAADLVLREARLRFGIAGQAGAQT